MPGRISPGWKNHAQVENLEALGGFAWTEDSAILGNVKRHWQDEERQKVKSRFEEALFDNH